MKLWHRFQAWRLRRRLVVQRTQNIIELRRGRMAARDLRRQLARAARLGVANPRRISRQEPASRPVTDSVGADSGSQFPGISSVLGKIQFERRAA
jgi:hypothetical protein